MFQIGKTSQVQSPSFHWHSVDTSICSRYNAFFVWTSVFEFILNQAPLITHKIAEEVRLLGTFGDYLDQCFYWGRVNWRRLLRAVSICILNITKDGDTTATFGNPFKSLFTFTIKKLFTSTNLSCVGTSPYGYHSEIQREVLVYPLQD